MEGWFEDFAVGRTYRSAELLVTEEAITQFGRQYDPQIFHLDAETAESTVFGRLVASGWQTAAYTMRLLVDGGGLGSKGAIVVGVDDLRWLHPVSAGDVIHLVSEVVSTRPSETRPVGIVQFRLTTRNGRDVDVLVQRATMLIPRREGDARTAPVG